MDKAHERATDLIRQAISTMDGRPLTLDRQSAMIEQIANENAAARLHAMRAFARPLVLRSSRGQKSRIGRPPASKAGHDQP